MPTDHAHTVTGIKLAAAAAAAAAAAVIVGGMVLVGWAFDIAALKSVLPGWVSMKANAAACFILIGIALWLTARQSAPRSSDSAIFLSRLARLCGLLAGLIGLLTLVEYIFGWNPGIDQWLVREAAGAVGTSDPGRMAPETALCFVLLAAALWITGSSRKTRWTILASVNLGLLVTTLALAAMLSYLTPGLGPYGWFGLTIMAMHTSVLFAMLGMAVIAISWQQDILPWSLGRNTTVALACGMALLVFIGLSINRSQFWLVDTNRKIAYSEEVLNNTVSLQVELAEAHAHARGYIITGDERFLKSYLEAIAGYNKKMGTLRQLIAGSPHQQQQASLIETNVDLLQRWTQQFIDAPRTGMTNTTRSKIGDHGGDLLDNIRITFNQIENEHQQFIRGLKQEAESVARFSYLTIATGTFASLLIFLTVIFRLNFAVNERQSKELALQESEQRFRLIVETMDEVFWVADVPIEKMHYISPGYERIWGRTAQSLYDNPRSFIQAIYPEDTERVLSGLEAEKAGQPFSHEYRIVRPDATIRWIWDRGFPIRDKAGKVTRYAGVAQDITERKQADAELLSMTNALRESQQLLDSIVEHIPVMVFVKRASDLCFELFNRAGEKLLGYSRNDLLGKGNYDLWPKDQGDWFTAADRKVLASHEATEIPEEPIKTASGETRYLHTWKVALRDESGEPAHLLGISIDITEQKLAKAKLAEQVEELRRWHDVTMGREMRTLELKHEVNELLVQAGQQARYPSTEADDKEYPDV